MKKILMLLVCAVMLAGCTKSNIVNATSQTVVANPDLETQSDIEIDWSQVSAEAGEYFNDQDEFPSSEDFHFMLQPETNEIMLMWVVADDMTADELDRYSETLIKGFNDIVAVQDFSIETSDEDSYGGLWKRYSLSYGIAPVSTQEDEDTWYANGSFPVGQDFVIPKAGDAVREALKNDAEMQEDESGEEAEAGMESE